MNQKSGFEKKAVIGTTLSWIAGFIIIFVLILLFFGFASSIAANKKLSFGMNEITLKKGGSSLTSNNFLNFLNSEIDTEFGIIKIREALILIEEDNAESSRLKLIIENELSSFAKDFGYTCYAIQTDSGKILIRENKGKAGYGEFSSLNLFSFTQNIKINYFIGKC